MGSTRGFCLIVPVALAGTLLTCAPVRGQPCYEVQPIVCTTNDPQFFYGLMFDQPLNLITFETLPNGQPSVSGTQITPAFNYTSWGVTFTAPLGTPTIGGFGPGAHNLQVSMLSDPFAHTWLRADLVHPSSGVGIYFNGSTRLTAFDARGTVIASQNYGFSGGPWFIGIVSEIPISYVTADRGTNFEIVNDFVFSPIPEPTGVLPLAVGILLVRHRRSHRPR